MFFVLVLLGSVALSGCGRRGPLELPPGTPGQPAAENTTTLADKQAAAFNEAAPPGVIQSPNQVVQVDKTSAQLAAQPPERAINAPRPAKASTFLLDPLL
ncbi:lipoprotein [Beijerinckia sp. L45]|uniref:LPS translocon maturation chaperone LptM n=1 Tax=Beijerinckia sp. L45 TaxID=1641855 RepID=UPI00131EBCD4|nr:lipoprotein [Beijerinckia sp. L45]